MQTSTALVKIVQKWFEEHEFEMLISKLPRLIEHLTEVLDKLVPPNVLHNIRQVVLILQLTGVYLNKLLTILTNICTNDCNHTLKLCVKESNIRESLNKTAVYLLPALQVYPTHVALFRLPAVQRFQNSLMGC